MKIFRLKFEFHFFKLKSIPFFFTPFSIFVCKTENLSEIDIVNIHTLIFPKIRAAFSRAHESLHAAIFPFSENERLNAKKREM